MSKRITRQQYLDTVVQKLQDPKVDSMLRYGPLGDKTATPLRDDVGMSVTFSNILQTATNLYDRCGGDLFAGALATNFSQVSYGDVSAVQTMGAVDVDIIALSSSLVPFLAIDRAMANPIDTIYFSDLVAVDQYGDPLNGGIAADGTVVGNFQAPINVNTSLLQTSFSETASGTSVTIAATSPIVPGSVNVTATVSGTAYSGSDITKDGKIYLVSEANAVLSAITTVNYKTGTIVVSGLASSDTVTGSYTNDSISDVGGSDVLKVRPEYRAVQLVTKPKSFIFQDNEATSMYMNRILANAAKVTGLTNYTTMQFTRLTNLYTENVNRDLIGTLVSMSAGKTWGTNNTLDVSGYSVASSFAETKNDKISQLFIDSASEFMSTSGVSPTVIVCGSKVASFLINIPLRFVAGPNAMTSLNGFIGTFNGIPVYRHNFIDQTADAATNGDDNNGTATYAHFYMASKLPDNSSGSIAFGEFLPLTRTATAQNFNNPLQNSTGWFSQVAAKSISNNLVNRGRLKLV
jgi:hypothetical protein